MKKVALVVQRCHESLVGGSESLAWQYANFLKDAFQVEVITTTALDYMTWDNVLHPGLETRDNISIRRFPVTIGRSAYWHSLHEQLIRSFQAAKLTNLSPNGNLISWSFAIQEEYIRYQGPYSEPLIDFLRQRESDYHCIIFFTYLYPTTYFGINQISASPCLLVPTLHDEPPAYLTAYKYMAQKVGSVIWLTNAEKQLGENLWENLPGKAISMGIETKSYNPIDVNYKYILYCGRITPSKGCQELFDFFIQFKEENPSNLRLVLTGKAEMKIPRHPDIDFKGFVSSEKKFELMAGATIFVMPSSMESFSIVTLEAMAQKTPVLVNGNCQVLLEHIIQSKCGKLYKDYESFSQGIEELLANASHLTHLGELAREYVVSHYGFDNVSQRLIELIEQC